MKIEFVGKVILVTGGAQGIGAAIVLELLRSEAKAVYIADLERQRGTAEELLVSLRTAGLTGGEFIVLDVADEAHHERVVSEIVAKHGRLDILINCAGVGPNSTTLKSEPDKLDLILKINVRGPVLLTQRVATQMVAQKGGVVVWVVSVAGVVGIPNHLYYSMAKHALIGAIRVMAAELVKLGVRVCGVAPARTNTPWVQQRAAEMAAASGGTESASQVLAEMSSTQGTGQMLSPEEVAAQVLFLASDYARAVTGSIHLIDDGWTAV